MNCLQFLRQCFMFYLQISIVLELNETSWLTFLNNESFDKSCIYEIEKESLFPIDFLSYFFLLCKNYDVSLFLKNSSFLTLLLYLMILTKVISFIDDELSILLYINQLFRHFIQVHEIDIENYFFKDLFKRDVNVFVLSKCLRCKYFL